MKSSQALKSPVVKASVCSRCQVRGKGSALLSEDAWLEIGHVLKLTERELEVVQGVFDNLRKEGIAERLGISDHTVHTHLNRLFKKLNVTTRAELVLLVVDQWINPSLDEIVILSPSHPNYKNGPVYSIQALPNNCKPQVHLSQSPGHSA